MRVAGNYIGTHTAPGHGVFGYLAYMYMYLPYLTQMNGPKGSLNLWRALEGAVLIGVGSCSEES